MKMKHLFNLALSALLVSASFKVAKKTTWPQIQTGS